MVLPKKLGRATASQLGTASPTLVIPVGATEQHGPHLPLDTDCVIAAAVADAAVDRLPAGDHLLAPTINYGASGEHEGFAGTVSIGTVALCSLLVEYGRSALRWAGRLAFVNGHGGNVSALRQACATLRAEGRDAGWCACWTPDADAHAGHTETSLLLHLSPAAVRVQEWQPGNLAPLAELMPRMRRGGLLAVSEVGVLGDPTTASAAAGERIFADMVDGCVRAIERWQPADDGRLR